MISFRTAAHHVRKYGVVQVKIYRKHDLVIPRYASATINTFPGQSCLRRWTGWASIIVLTGSVDSGVRGLDR